MRVRSVHCVLVWFLLTVGAEIPARAETDAELAELGQRVIQIYRAGNYAEGIPLAERFVVSTKSRVGENDPAYADAIGWLARLLQATGRQSEAELLMRRALAIDETSLGSDHPDVAIRLNNLAQLLQAAQRLSEADALLRRALKIDETRLGPDHPAVATSLNNLAALLQDANKPSEAEPLLRRALTLYEKSLGPEHPHVAIALNNLAIVLSPTNRSNEAEALLRRAITLFEHSLGPDDANVAIAMNNLAQLLKATNRWAQAEPLLRRALEIDEKCQGPDHLKVAARLTNLAQLLEATNRLAEAESLLRRALAIDEARFGPDHPHIASDIDNLAKLLAERGDWAGAAALGRRAKPILLSGDAANAIDGTGPGMAVPTRRGKEFRFHARSLFRASGASDSAGEEGFELAQWALQSDAAGALSQVSTRVAKGEGPLSDLVRDRLAQLARRKDQDGELLAAVGRADARSVEQFRASLANLDAKIEAIDVQLAAEFKEFSQLTAPKPLTIAEAQALLKDDEALLLFLDVPLLAGLPEETLVWVVNKQTSQWRSIPLGTRALADLVAALRCGLDRAAWEGERASRCVNLLEIPLNEAPGDAGPLPFDLVRAQELYSALFGQVEDLVKDKHLLIVPSGPLTGLQFHVLVTAPPRAGIPTDAAGYREVAWLGVNQPITYLPSVASLKALRETPRVSRALKAYIGFGNPLLDGPNRQFKPQAELARARQQCPPAQGQPMSRGGSAMSPPRQHGLLADPAQLRMQVPLPETADELCAVAGFLAAPQSDIWLGARASEAEVKRLSASGALAAYHIVHFATYGALAGRFDAGAEPGLLLTPPKEASLEEDGYLSASEIAGLKLDADWVILSACNTAAGGADEADGLSGIARAFFYAGTRALLVSHWAADSSATVKLISKTLSTLAADAAIGRSEALRRTMIDMIANGEPAAAHPAYWAPLVVAGDGGAEPSLQTTSSIVPGPAGPPKAKSRPANKSAPPDWKAGIWRR
jgi:CHAT domain-containing protein/tetratricopeptide (TPR) repeat protein